jgi:hypothetical protein
MRKAPQRRLAICKLKNANRRGANTPWPQSGVMVKLPTETTNMKFNSGILFLACASLCLASGAFAYSGEKLAKGANVTMKAATEIALKARQGKITDRELEKEAGGSGLRYSFDIRADKVTYEVGVDAQTGAVLENGREGAHPD